MKYNNKEDIGSVPTGTEVVNLDFIRSVIFTTEEDKIKPFQHITSEAMEMLKQGSLDKRYNCFIRNTNSETDYFFVDVNCCDCNKKMVYRLSKSRTLDYLNNKVTILCKECEAKREELKKIKKEQMIEEKKRWREQQKEETNRNTKNFIEEYLDPNKKWPAGMQMKDKVMPIIYHKNSLNSAMIAEYIQNMEYKDFLNTKYWQAVATHAKYKANYSCQLCGDSSSQLNTHHKTYKRHGYEHDTNVIKEDLIVLCQNCHGKFHDKLKD